MPPRDSRPEASWSCWTTRGGWPTTFAFRHAVRYLYGDGVSGLVRGGADFLYPWRVTSQGIVVDPWPVIRSAWQVAPTLHPWDTILVVHQGADGRLAILPKWPENALPPLAAGARVRARGTDPPDRGPRPGEACAGREGAALSPLERGNA